MRVLLLFLDGVGIGRSDPSRNPFLRARLPVLRELVGDVPTLDRPRLTRSLTDLEAGGDVPAGVREAVAFPLDATLDVDGTPQSGTGQAALLTGLNAARHFGRHFGPWTPVGLRPLVEERSLLRRTLDGGRSAAFANAYPEDWPGERRRRRVAAPPLAARAAGLLVRHADDLREGRAVASEIVNDGWIRHTGLRDLPRVTPEEAGALLAGIVSGHDLTLFAHYSTDLAGHRGGMDGAVKALERVDRFLGGVLDRLPRDALLVVASDHGNVEDVTGGHTRNPVLGVMAGPGAVERADGLTSIMDVMPAILGWLEEDGGPP